MDVVSTTELYVCLCLLLGILFGLASIVALLSRTRLSQVLGGISIFLVSTFYLAPPALGWRSRMTTTEWLVLCMYMTPGMLGIVANRAGRRKRRPPGHCVQCGYNLTGNVSGRCPECGNRIISESMTGV